VVPQGDKICRHEKGKAGKACPTLTHAKTLQASRKEYKKPKIRKFARNASIQEAQCFSHDPENPGVLTTVKPRIVEICEFAKKMNYKRLGIAFCNGVRKEASVVEQIFTVNGFEVVSVICKAGRTPKEELGITDEEKIEPGKYEVMCNPINQALILNQEKTDFNVAICLCVGHDSLFFQYSKAPVTVLAAKDRLTGHNPLAPIYTVHSYYRRLVQVGYQS
jgi:uncharacterized metal-binding protein